MDPSADATMAQPVRIDPRRAAWARDALELSDDAGRAEATRAFLRLLPDEGFVPWGMQWDAVRTFTDPDGDSAATGDEYYHWRANELREQIDSLRREMFSLSIDARKARWEALRQACEPFPHLQQPLVVLQPALEVAGDGGRLTGDVESLAQQIVQLTTLAAEARSARRREILAGCAGDAKRWARAASRLRRRDASVFRLDRQLTQQLLEGRRRSERLRKAHRAAMQRRATTVSSSSSVSPWWVGVAVLLMLAGIRWAIRQSDRERTRPAYNPIDVQSLEQRMRELDLRRQESQRQSDRIVRDPLERLEGQPIVEGPFDHRPWDTNRVTPLVEPGGSHAPFPSTFPRSPNPDLPTGLPADLFAPPDATAPFGRVGPAPPSPTIPAGHPAEAGGGLPGPR